MTSLAALRARFTDVVEDEAMLRAAIFRLFSDRPVDPAAYASALGPLLARSAR